MFQVSNYKHVDEANFGYNIRNTSGIFDFHLTFMGPCIVNVFFYV